MASIPALRLSDKFTELLDSPKVSGDLKEALQRISFEHQKKTALKQVNRKGVMFPRQPQGLALEFDVQGNILVGDPIVPRKPSEETADLRYVVDPSNKKLLRGIFYCTDRCFSEPDRFAVVTSITGLHTLNTMPEIEQLGARFAKTRWPVFARYP